MGHEPVTPELVQHEYGRTDDTTSEVSLPAGSETIVTMGVQVFRLVRAGRP